MENRRLNDRPLLVSWSGFALPNKKSEKNECSEVFVMLLLLRTGLPIGPAEDARRPLLLLLGGAMGATARPPGAFSGRLHPIGSTGLPKPSAVFLGESGKKKLSAHSYLSSYVSWPYMDQAMTVWVMSLDKCLKVMVNLDLHLLIMDHNVICSQQDLIE